MKRRDYQQQSNFNYALLLPIFLMLLLSIWLQYWVGYYDDNNPLKQAGKQVIFVLLGTVCMFGVKYIRRDIIWKAVPWFYLFSLLLMGSLYFFYDVHMYDLTGTKRWLDIFGIQFQPSELAKTAYILFISKELVKYNQKKERKTIKTDLKMIGWLAIVSAPLFFLMFVQKDFGTSLVFITVLGALIIASGINWRIVAVLFVILGVIGGGLIFLVFTESGQAILSSLHFKEYQLNRVRAWVDPFEYAGTIAYQQVQGLLAIGSGGMFGKGTTGVQVYVPVRESDMIFTFVGEAYGFIGATAVILLYFYLFFQIFFTGIKSNSTFNIYICVGIVFMLVFQTFENIGASIGLLPLTGIPLPFLSQGGTALVSTMLALGLIFGMDTTKTEHG